MKDNVYLLIQSDLDIRKVTGSLSAISNVVWVSPIYGPDNIVAYLEADSAAEMENVIEDIRARRYIKAVDSRPCKVIPGQQENPKVEFTLPVRACLMINVDYHTLKERDLVSFLKGKPYSVQVRACWGPSDTIALIEAKDNEDLRNIVCDEIKIYPGVKSLSTRVCYQLS
ncbi:MAG: Lrp/AsnC family transcriptional regulator [Symploca sp. SIO2G7]|nr:Lrp/AsnC family transcriptional regulator [Symploca sp. SIO2G7]